MTIRLWLLLAVVCSGLVVGLSSTASATTEQEEASLLGEPEAIDADDVRIDIGLQADGTAAWTIEFWVHLEDDESTAAFESLQTDIEDDPELYTQAFADRITNTVTVARETTDREMAAEEFDVQTERQSLAREYGVVRYTFDWQEFASTDGEELHVGDAIEGLYLEDGTRLLIHWPDAYESISVTPDPDEQREQAVIWYGEETTFVSGEPQVVLSPAGSGLSWPVIVGMVGALGVGIGVAIWWVRLRPRDVSELSDGDTLADDGPQPVSQGGSFDGDTSLLSNEEQVLALIESHGGRLKQQTVVTELEWTDAKTSKVVSTLRAEDKLESFRIGRENVLRIPDAETDSTDPLE